MHFVNIFFLNRILTVASDYNISFCSIYLLK